MEEKKVKWLILPLLLFFFGVICFVYRGQVAAVAAEAAPAPVYEGKSGDHEVAFAMNVDWGTAYIPQVLSLLKEHDIAITFFLTGRWCGENPAVAKEIYRAGMEIGNHGLRHRSPNAMSYEENVADIKAAEETICDTLSIKTTLFAPAAGEIDSQVLNAAEDLGYTTILWSADTIDWQKPAPEVMVERVEKKLKDGAIVLMHPTENTVTALPHLIKVVEEKGLTVVPVSKVID